MDTKDFSGSAVSTPHLSRPMWFEEAVAVPMPLQQLNASCTQRAVVSASATSSEFGTPTQRHPDAVTCASARPFDIVEYCPKQADFKGGSQMLVIGAWSIDHSHQCIFGTTAVDAKVVQHGVLSCITPPQVAGQTQLRVHVIGVGYSPPVPFNFCLIGPVDYILQHSEPGEKEMQSRGDELTRAAVVGDNATILKPDKSLHDITWQDFLSSRDQQKFAEMSLSDSAFRSGHLSCSNRKEIVAARTIQHAFRRHLKTQRSRRQAVLLIENTYRQYKEREQIGRAQAEAAAVKIQSRFRGYKEKVKYARSRKAIVTVQRLIR